MKRAERRDATLELPSSLIDVDPSLRAALAMRLLVQLYPLGGLEQRLLKEQNGQQPSPERGQVLHVGPRLVVCQPGDSYNPRPDEILIKLDLGLAFGTGYHPTTQMCLEEMERCITPGARVLDVGTGSGILAIAAAALGAASVLALDTDPQAVYAARSNVRLNRVGRRVRVQPGSVPLQAPEPYHVVLANLSARLVSDLADPLAQATAPQGILIASGFRKERVGPVAKRLVNSEFRVVRTLEVGGWATLACQKTP